MCVCVCVCVCVIKISSADLYSSALGGGGGLLLDVFFCVRVDECITGGTVL